MTGRLIDGEALEKAIYEWMPKDQETWMDSDLPPIENLVVSIMMTIQEQPTVEAIPVEWIRKWEAEAVDFDDKESIARLDKAGGDFIKWMILDWEAERKEE